MDNILETKLNINNNAALAIQDGNYSDAKQLLTSALFALKETLQVQNNDESVVSTVAASTFNGYCSFLPVSRGQDTADSMTATEDTCFLFNSPVQIKSSLEEGGIASTTSNTVTVNVTTLTQVVVYNLALCIHLQASETSVPVLMKRAISMYGKVASALLSSIAGTTSNTSTSQFLKIAVANNMGHCYDSLRLTPQAQLCFQELANSIAVYNTNYDHQQQRHQLDVGFISNAMLGCWRANSKSAPAA